MYWRQPVVLIPVFFFIILALAMYLARVGDDGSENVNAVSAGDAVTSDFNTAASGDVVREGIKGDVVDEAGKPVEGALIQPVSIDGAGPVPDMAVVTDANGRFVWRLRPGLYRVEAILGGRVIATEELVVGDGVLATIRLVAADGARE